MRFLLAAFLLLLPASVEACADCTMAMVWGIFPPLPWILFGGAIWYFLMVAVNGIFGMKLIGLPNRREGYQRLALYGSVLAVLSIGMWPFTTILCIGFATVAFVNFIERRIVKERIKGSWAVVGVTSVYLILIAAVSCPEFVRPTPRGPMGMIMQWGCTAYSHRAFDKLVANEPASINDYRSILKNSNSSYHVDRAAVRLVEIGDPQQDLPAILDALVRQNRFNTNYGLGQLAPDLAKFLGVKGSDIQSLPGLDAAIDDYLSSNTLSQSTIPTTGSLSR